MKFALFVLVISAASLGPTFVKKQLNLLAMTMVSFTIYCQSESDQLKFL